MRTIWCLILAKLFILNAAQAQDRPPAAPLSPLDLRSASRLQVRPFVDDDQATYLESDGMQGHPDQSVSLIDHAQVRRRGMVLKGDRIDYKKQAGQVDAQGHARLLRDTDLLTGPSLQYHTEKGSGKVEDPKFWIGSQGGFACAAHADLFSRSKMRLKQATYVGCACEEPDWYIKANQVDLDFDANEGIAHNGILYFKKIPILGSPYLSFPLKKERKSGLLIPTYGTTTNSGFEIMAPYYFNLAPNYDITLQPRLFSKRGSQIGAEFRYLGDSSSGITSGTYLSHDRLTQSARWYYSTQHQQSLGNGFAASWNINAASDDDYFRDFSLIGLNEASTASLIRQAQLSWSNDYVQTFLQVYKTQTLQDPKSLSMPQFDKVPELTLKAARYDWKGIDAELSSSAVRFKMPLAFDRNTYTYRRLGPSGDRLSTYASLAYPIVKPGWFVIPKIALHHAYYLTSWYGGNWNGLPDSSAYQSALSRTLPIGSIDAGLIFDRESSLFGKASRQTLEPRLYYLKVPYRDQTTLPVYDTSLADFSFAQAFEENLYNGGWDRIANANQITGALTTRWMDTNTGFQRLAFSVAQRIYLEDQKVTLPGEKPRKNERSDYLALASAALTDTLTTEVAGQYNPYYQGMSRALAGVRWSPQPLTSVALSYRYQRDYVMDSKYLPKGQSQISLALQWPFTSHIWGVGRVDYSLDPPTTPGPDAIQLNRITQAIAGLEYKSDCCWTGRLVFQRYAISTIEYNTAFFVQLELNGLGSLGTNPLELLSKNIAGYENIKPSPIPDTPFEHYE